jgi:hypothetical protein
MTRLGISTSRVFSVGMLPESAVGTPASTLEKPIPLMLNSVCNAATTELTVDHYSFEARRGQRIVIDCAAQGIDSKLTPVVIVADHSGRDLKTQRGGGAIDFTVPSDGRYLVKVHDFTFAGGTHYFYRLLVQELSTAAPRTRQATTRSVESFSWPPDGLADLAETLERVEQDVQHVSLPCDIAGSFYPVGDVDCYEFAARQGETWWVEVASERLGESADPNIIIERVEQTEQGEQLTDVVELSDIPSPVKLSSNGYAYDGPHYNAGSLDILGKVEIKQDGIYRLRIRNLFGGSKEADSRPYRLIIRPAMPDFTLVSWGVHMMLRNGDRNVLSKPLALRSGATMALEVVAIRRDGFDGPIELSVDGLPSGVTACGLRIPAGENRGIMLLMADDQATRGLARVDLSGFAEIQGKIVKRRCHLASVVWPVKDHRKEIPKARLLTEVFVSVSGFDVAPLTIGPQSSEVLEVTAGEILKIPLYVVVRSELSQAALNCRVFGHGFESLSAVDLPLNEPTTEVTLDLSKLKTPPGDYQLAFYGGAVVKQYKTLSSQLSDIADIFVSKPINVRVLPAEEK